MDQLDDPGQREIDTVIGSLRADARDIRVFFPVLGAKLAASLPEAVDLERGGNPFRRRRPVRRITVRLEDDLLEAELTPAGLVCRDTRFSSGISQEVDLESWMRVLLSALRRRARTAAEARDALRFLVT